MDAFGPVITIIFFVVIVFCTFVVGWLTGYEKCRRELMRALKVPYEHRGTVEPPIVDTSFETYSEATVYDLASFRQKKRKKKEGDIDDNHDALEWGLVWSEHDQTYVKVSRDTASSDLEED